MLNTSPNLVVFDTVNDGGGNHCAKSVEAFIRLIWAANPSTRIIIMRAFSVPATHDIDTADQVTSGELDELDAIAAAYGITVVDYYSAVKALIDGGAAITTYVSGDWVHPTATGYALMASLLAPYLPNGGTSKPSTLPARVYDTNGYFENAPTKILGTAYDSRVGTWSDSGGEVSSSTPSDTITYTVTSAPAHSIGCYRADGGTNTVQISYDGGAFNSVTFYQNGVEVPSGFTTVTIKVSSGTVKIGEFWAI